MVSCPTDHEIYKEKRMAIRGAPRTRTREVQVVTEDTVASVYVSALREDSEKREVIDVRKFVTEPAYVRVSAGVTKNIGNYESLRVDVAITAPCYIEEVKEVEERIAVMVSDMLTKEVDEYLGTTT